MDKKVKQQIPFLKYDTSRMNEDIPIRDVIALYTGKTPRGQANISCPSPKHPDDKHPSAHIYDKDNRCKCFACGGNFSPISLAKEYFPELSFPDLCQKLLDDFGMDVYSYSNKHEIDMIKDANERNKFYDFFPVTEDELKTIGLNNPNREKEFTYPVKATEYYNHFYGEIPPLAEVYDKDGNELLVQCTAGEAREMGMPTRTPDQDHEYITGLPTVQELWREDKKGVEEMIVGKCYETMDNLISQIGKLEKDVDTYRSTHTTNQIKEADKLRDGYIKAVSSGHNVKLTDVQREKINGLYAFEKDKDVLSLLNQRLDAADKILKKIQEHQQERKEAMKTAKKNVPFGGR